VNRRGKTRTVIIQLDEQEIRKSKEARADGRDPHGLWGMAYAMRKACSTAPKGFFPVSGSCRHVVH